MILTISSLVLGTYALTLAITESAGPWGLLKRLYAESVIGQDEYLMGNVTGNYYFQADKDDLIRYGNQVRAEQRKRVKYDQ